VVVGFAIGAAGFMVKIESIWSRENMIRVPVQHGVNVMISKIFSREKVAVLLKLQLCIYVCRKKKISFHWFYEKTLISSPNNGENRTVIIRLTPVAVCGNAPGIKKSAYVCTAYLH
jgi:hypothetical protein